MFDSNILKLSKFFENESSRSWKDFIDTVFSKSSGWLEQLVKLYKRISVRITVVIDTFIIIVFLNSAIYKIPICLNAKPCS